MLQILRTLYSYVADTCLKRSSSVRETGLK